MSTFDCAVCAYIARKCSGDVEDIFCELVDAIGKGNGEFVTDLCAKLGCPGDMYSAAEAISKRYI